MPASRSEPRACRLRAPTTPAALLGWLLVAAAAGRAAALASLSTWVWFGIPGNDAAVYHLMGRRFARGDFLIGHEALRMSPGYPYFVGLVYRLFGDGVWPLRVAQALAGVALAGLVWDAARRLFGPRWAVVAGAAVAFFGPLVFHEAQILSDGLATSASGAVLWLAVVFLTRPETRPGRWLGLGLLAGGLCLLRPNALLLAVPLALAAARVSPLRRAPRTAALLLGVVLGLVPLPLRNWAATGEPVIFAAHGGLNFYVGNGPGATGSFRTPADVPQATSPARQFEAFHAQAEREEGRRLDARAADRHWYRRTLLAIADAPGRWLELMARKLVLFWGGRSISDIESYALVRQLDPVLGGPWLQFRGFMVLALAGTLLFLMRPGAPRLVALFNLAWCASVVLFFVVDRYRLPALPGLALAATGALEALATAVRRWRDTRRAAAAPPGTAGA